MAYTPPDGLTLALEFSGGYVPPAGLDLQLEFRPALNQTRQGQTLAGLGQFVRATEGATSQGHTISAAALIRDRRPPMYAQAAMRWDRGAVRDLATRLSWERPAYVDPVVTLTWDSGEARDIAIRLPFAASTHQDATIRLPFERAMPRALEAALPWSRPNPRDQQRRAPWRHARFPHGVEARLPWVSARKRDQARRLPWTKATPIDHKVWLATGRAKPRDRQARLPWDMGRPPRLQYLPVPPYIPPPGPPPAPPCYVPPDWNRVVLRFVHGNTYVPPTWNQVPLAFACDRHIFRIARSLRVSHSLSVVRLPDRLPLNVTAVSMTTDRDSWAWSFSLRFADRASLLACAPSPEGVTSIEITLDGYVWTALVENYTESRELARKQAAATGRSRTALLAAPYDAERSYQNEESATAQQLALRELDFSGFALDWQIVDWTALAGAWSYERETHMGAILRVAAAAGGIVQAATDSDTLIVLPRHPYAPWEIASADVDMTIDAGSCLNLGKRYVAGPGYNGVYVMGRDKGLRVRIRRDETSGSPFAEAVIDNLISDTGPAVSRGKSILTASNTREEISLLVPLIPSPAPPGLLTPGKLLEVEDATWGAYRAVVTGVSVDAEISGDGALIARQNVTVERYITA